MLMDYRLLRRGIHMSFHKRSIIILCFVFIFMASAILSGCDNVKPVPTATVVPTEVPAEPAATVEEAPAETAEEAAAVEEAPAEAPAAEEAAVDENEVVFVATVDGEGISKEDFEMAATFHRYQYLGQYNQYAQMYSMYGLPLDSLNEQVESILGEGGKEKLGLDTIDELTYNKVLELEAKEAGIEADEDEVYTLLKTMFGYEDPSKEDDKILGLDSFNVTPDETDDDEDKYALFKQYAQMVLDMGYDGVVSFDYLKNYAEHQILDNKLFERELSERVFESEMVNARHILVENEETAKEILAKLEAGEDWDTLASENSLDTSNKDNSGSLGWFGKGEMVSEFEEAAFALEPGQISEPVKTTYGYHIIASDGKEIRPLEGSALQSAQQKLYDSWAIGLREKHDLQSFEELWLEAVPMVPVFEPIVTEQEVTAETAEETVSEAESPVEETAAENEAETPAVVEETSETTEETAADETPAEENVPETAQNEPAPTEELVTEAEQNEPAPAEEATAETKDNIALTVDGEGITTDEFEKMAIFNRYQVIASYQQYAQYYSMFGIPLDEVNAYYEELLGENGKAEFGESIVNQLAYFKMLDLEAEKTGITVSDQDVMTEIKKMFGYTDAAAEAQDALGLDSFNVGDEDSSADSAAADEKLESEITMDLELTFGDKITFDFFKNYVRNGMIEEALVEKALEGRVFEEEMVNARHILVENEETAKEILAKLEAGEDWAALAAEHSMDPGNKDNSGSLGWFGRGRMVSEFEDAAFSLEPGQISEPVKTSYGYHIIASDGKEIRAMEGDALEAAKTEAASEWLDALQEKYTVESFQEVWLPFVPTEPVFEPIEIDIQADESIPTYSIGSDEKEVDNGEPAAVGEETEPDADNTSQEDESLTIDNTEQDSGAFLLNNDAELNK